MAYSRKRLLVVVVVVPLAVALPTTMVVLLLTPPPSPAAQDAVDEHNKARADVGVMPVTWNDTLAEYADSYAELRKDDCKLVHSDGPYGENLFWGSGTDTDYTAAGILGEWVSEKQYYDHDSNSCAAPAGKECAAYTQVVWGRTTSIGCALVVCSNGGGVFVICSYYPAGNVDGESPY